MKLTPAEEQAINHLSRGHRHTLLLIAAIKRVLKNGVSPGERVHLVEKIEGMVDIGLTAEGIAAVEPMSDEEYALIVEASANDRDDARLNPSFDYLTDGKVFRLFLSLNP